MFVNIHQPLYHPPLAIRVDKMCPTVSELDTPRNTRDTVHAFSGRPRVIHGSPAGALSDS